MRQDSILSSPPCVGALRGRSAVRDCAYIRNRARVLNGHSPAADSQLGLDGAQEGRPLIARGRDSQATQLVPSRMNSRRGRCWFDVLLAAQNESGRSSWAILKSFFFIGSSMGNARAMPGRNQTLSESLK